MNASVDYITEEKRKELEKELTDLKGPKRKEILKSLEYAKSLGDLSENAEYHQAREDQGKLEVRITKIEQILQSSKTISKTGGDIVDIGSNVLVQKIGNTKPSAQGKGEKTYTIVGSEEADMAQGKISNKSPFGIALFGKKKGDNISFTTPSGAVNYKIIKVS